MKKAFEVEDLIKRDNFVFVYDPEDRSVSNYDTSINRTRKLLLTYSEKDGALYPAYPEKNNFQLNPLGCQSAKEYFETLYNKSLKMDNSIAFLGWVNPETFESIEEE